GQVEPDDRPPAAQVAALATAQPTLAAGQLGPRRDAVAGAEPADAVPGLQDAGAELVPEELERRLGLQPALDAVEGPRRDARGQLRLRDARLHAERLDQHVPRTADGLGNVVEPHVVEAVEAPGSHRVMLRRSHHRSPHAPREGFLTRSVRTRIVGTSAT